MQDTKQWSTRLPKSYWKFDVSGFGNRKYVQVVKQRRGRAQSEAWCPTYVHELLDLALLQSLLELGLLRLGKAGGKGFALASLLLLILAIQATNQNIRVHFEL